MFAEPVALMAGAAAAGDPIAVLPVLFHLLWRHELVSRPVGAAARRDTGRRAVALMARWRSVLRPGDWVHFDGGEHQVVALAGTSVRLRSADGAEIGGAGSHLMAAPDFARHRRRHRHRGWSRSGCWTRCPRRGAGARRGNGSATSWRSTTGLPPDARPARRRARIRPGGTHAGRAGPAKAAELAAAGQPLGSARCSGCGPATPQQGLWGLVDQRAVRECEATGRADARLVAAVREAWTRETDASTGTRSRLIRRVVKALEAHLRAGVVPLPGKTTFYKLIDALSTGRHTLRVGGHPAADREPAGRAVHRRRSRPGRVSRCRSTPPRWT